MPSSSAQGTSQCRRATYRSWADSIELIPPQLHALSSHCRRRRRSRIDRVRNHHVDLRGDFLFAEVEDVRRLRASQVISRGT
jgi:hypothetical protein